MSKKATLHATVCALVIFVLNCNETFGQEQMWGRCSRGTLFHWGEGFTGGPNLDEPIVTDRPDFTEASSTVGWGVSQIELGYTYSFANDGTDQSIQHTFPEALNRRGIFANWLELRLVNGYVSDKLNGDDTTGREDLQVGFKIGLTPQQGWLPETALITQMVIPTGDSDITDDAYLPGANIIYAWELNDYFSLAGSSQVNQAVDALDSKYSEFAQSIAVGMTLTEHWGGYAEWFAIFSPNDAAGRSDQQFFNGGFTLLVTNDILWDIRAGAGLNENVDEYFVGTGVSIRFH